MDISEEESVKKYSRNETESSFRNDSYRNKARIATSKSYGENSSNGEKETMEVKQELLQRPGR
jgi:hypothetical protein